jgi:hypothetical protein
MGRHKHRTERVVRWGDDWPTWPDPTRCNCCGDPQPVARYGMAPVCARCYDRWMRNRYRQPEMSENQRADMILDAWADAGTGPQEEAY